MTNFIKYLCIFFFSLALRSNEFYIYGPMEATANSFGALGLIQLPTAETRKAGSFSFTYNENKMWKLGTLSIAPFDWFEASYFYYRPSDYWYTEVWGDSINGNYLDKGFNIRLSYPLSTTIKVALGLEDFAGTGFFTREYLVATKKLNNIKLTLGLGTGYYNDIYNSKNPLSYLKDSFSDRPSVSSNYDLGGTAATDKFFRGEVGPIFGIEAFLPGFNKTSFKIELDPFDYMNFSSKGNPINDLARQKDSNLNYGFNYSFSKNTVFGLHFLKGNTINFTFTFGADFSRPLFLKKKNQVTEIISKNYTKDKKKDFYENLIFNTNRNNIFLQTADIQDDSLIVAVSSSKYRDPIQIHSMVGSIVNELNKRNEIGIKKFSTVGINVGTELYRISTPLKYASNKETPLEIIRYESSLDSGRGDEYQEFSFRPRINFPASFTGLAPALVNHIGDPRRFYYGGIVLRLDNEIQFNRRLQLNTELHWKIADNFDEKVNYPDSNLPHVRTDIVSYLQDSEIYISRSQLDYFFKSKDNLFGKMSFGILENMYAGAGFEFLYKEFNSNFSFGLEAYRVKKRAFNRKFGLLKYEASTAHLNINHYLPSLGILSTLSFGQYLAGDRGYTLDLSKIFSSGFRAGFFFTRTNVSAELFGEGSFDKGFYFQIPIDLFLNGYRGGYINFKLRPLTRDGGQKLEAGNDLIGLMHTTSRAEIERDWGSFND